MIWNSQQPVNTTAALADSQPPRLMTFNARKIYHRLQSDNQLPQLTHEKSSSELEELFCWQEKFVVEII